MRSQLLALLAVLALIAVVAAACYPAEGLPPAPVGLAAESPLPASSGAAVLTPAPDATPAVSGSEPLPAPAITEAVESPVMASPAVTATLPTSPTPATPTLAGPLVTYRDEAGGFEIDYPGGWWLVDVPEEIRQDSFAYSITLSSWQPQEDGRDGTPEGDNKIDIGLTKGAAETPEEAVEVHRRGLSEADPGAEVVFEEPWDLEGGLAASRWTVQPSQGPAVYEVVTAIGGNLIVVSGQGDPAVFEAVAMSLRPLAATAQAKPAETPAADAGEAALSGGAQPLAGTVYTVRSGDTLTKIAARFGTTVAAILATNPQITNPDRIFVGQVITIPSTGAQPPAPGGATRVNIYLVSIGDGSVGCGDGIEAVRRDVPRTPAPLTAALNLLLAERSQYYGESGLYNALYQSDLSISSITRSGAAWTVRLQGSLVLGGVCDGPRVKAQLEQTALQFSTVSSVRYYINGQPLETVISGR